jgi:hypothetical protein
MTFMSLVFLFPVVPNPTAIDMNYSIVVLGGILVLSVIYFYFPVYGGVYWFKGPVKTVGDLGEDSEGSRGSLEKRSTDKA